MTYFFNIANYVFSIEYEGKTYRIGLGKNDLPDGIKDSRLIATEVKASIKSSTGTGEIVLENETKAESNYPINIENVECEVDKASVKSDIDFKREEYIVRKNEILLSDKTERSKKMALTRLKREYGDLDEQ